MSNAAPSTVRELGAVVQKLYPGAEIENPYVPFCSENTTFEVVDICVVPPKVTCHLVEGGSPVSENLTA